MSKFITGKQLEDAVYDIIWNASNSLLIVSPYINLDIYFRKLFEKHLNNPRLQITIVFGKNENNVKRSLSAEDFDFFKKFLNVSVVYSPQLHGKYYGNETQGVITSINLYDFSFKNNVEFGVFHETNLLNSITKSVDQEAWLACWEIANNAEAVFIKRPVFEKKLISILGKNYVKSDILLDNTERYYKSSLKYKSLPVKRLSDYPDELELGSLPDTRPSREEVESFPRSVSIRDSKPKMGYCIRTGQQIPFDPSHPFCYEAYQEWAKWNNPNYPEKFCHRTGKPSNGKTSKSNPVLY
ncbi:MAG TPA: hypothetical protein PKI35_03265 [Bacteroidales bacterium]|nr:hypothetical protein [Bacteroidales bacterium]